MQDPSASRPTSAELDLLRVLWQQGPCTARQAHELLQRERPEVTEANVLRQLQLMHAKGQLSRDESQRAHVYAAVEPRERLQTQLLGDMARRLFSGSGKQLILTALRTQVDAGEREEIARLLSEGLGTPPGDQR